MLSAICLLVGLLYNPHDPEEAVLAPGVSSSYHSMLGVPVAFIGIALYGLRPG